MSSTSPLSDCASEKWSTVAPYLAPSLAAAGAIVPTGVGFAYKSARQVNEKFPLGIRTLSSGVRMAPTVGAIVGTQMLAQKVFELSFPNSEEKSSFSRKLGTSTAVAFLSVPGYLILNGQTLNIRPSDALKNWEKKQVASIITRETAFVFSLSASGPFSREMQERFGETETVKWASTFTAGVLGSLAGHPADTFLTCLQKNVSIDSVKSLSRGGLVKALSTGAFTALYSHFKEQLDPEK